MGKKVLLADDSLTIYKVISVSLEKKDLELIYAPSLNDAKNKLSSDIDLLLLDATLDDQQSGYEVLSDIRAKYPSLPVLLMFGTFDTIDHNKLSSFDKVVTLTKPFDGDSFLQTCLDLLDGKSVSSQEYGDNEFESGFDEGEDEWSVSESTDFNPQASAHNENERNDESESPSLQMSLKEWSVEIPDQIGNESREIMTDFPDKLENTREFNVGELLNKESMSQAENLVREKTSFKDLGPTENTYEKPPLDSNVEIQAIQQEDSELTKYPDSGDLEYPSQSHAGPKSKLVPLDDLKPEVDWGIDLDQDPTEVFQTEEEREDLVEKLQDELSEGETWSAEEIKPTNSTPSFDQDQMIQAITERVNQQIQITIEETIKKFLSNTAEKVAWEVIPDLAENIIKKELEKISDSIK